MLPKHGPESFSSKQKFDFGVSKVFQLEKILDNLNDIFNLKKKDKAHTSMI